MTYRDAELYGEAPSTENRAKREEFVPAQYVGLRPDLRDRKGDSYFDRNSDMWVFRPAGDSEWYRVKFESLRFVKKRVKKKR